MPLSRTSSYTLLLCILVNAVAKAWSQEEKASHIYLAQVAGASFSALGSRVLGISSGVMVVTLALCAIRKGKSEMVIIRKLFDANTTAADLERIVDKGGSLPSLVIIKGRIDADGRGVKPACPSIPSLRIKCGIIEQPENDYLDVASEIRTTGGLREVAQMTEKLTGANVYDSELGLQSDSICRKATDVTRVGVDQFARQDFVLTEMLMERICGKGQTRSGDRSSINAKVFRPKCNKSYTCFHARNVSENLHVIDQSGARMEVALPEVNADSLFGMKEPPSLFLATKDVWEDRFTLWGRGSSDACSESHVKLVTPYTLLSKFIFIDTRSPNDLGLSAENLECIARKYRSDAGSPRYLFEPCGFYDTPLDKDKDGIPKYASLQTACMVDARNFAAMAKKAAKENSRHTPFCEPIFQREELLKRRESENCFRFVEEAIPRGSLVTLVAKPQVALQGARCRVTLVPPSYTDVGGWSSRLDPRHFRFRILKGHTVLNLLKQRSLSIAIYYVVVVLGILFILWSAADFPGPGALMNIGGIPM